MCLRIWSIEDGACPVTIPAHKRHITGLAMVDRGKEIISSSAGRKTCALQLQITNYKSQFMIIYIKTQMVRLKPGIVERKNV